MQIHTKHSLTPSSAPLVKLVFSQRNFLLKVSVYLDGSILIIIKLYLHTLTHTTHTHIHTTYTGEREGGGGERKREEREGEKNISASFTKG